MRVLVTGGRDYTDYLALKAAMDMLPNKPSVVIHGNARGADALADRWALESGIFVLRMPALWDAQGKSAGMRRNAAMISLAFPEYCVAFPGGRGTAGMVELCRKAGIPVWVPY